MPLQLEIVTPDKTLYSGSVDMVVVPAMEGEMGILPMHIPLMTMLNPGEVTVIKDGKTDYLKVAGGFVEVTPWSVTVITHEFSSEEGASQIKN